MKNQTIESAFFALSRTINKIRQLIYRNKLAPGNGDAENLKLNELLDKLLRKRDDLKKGLKTTGVINLMKQTAEIIGILEKTKFTNNFLDLEQKDNFEKEIFDEILQGNESTFETTFIPRPPTSKELTKRRFRKTILRKANMIKKVELEKSSTKNKTNQKKNKPKEEYEEIL